MEYVFIQRPSDKEEILELLNNFKEYSKEELIEDYNKAVEIGIVGSRAQAQKLIALNITFKTIFSSSPIKIENNILIRLTDKIELDGNNWHYQKLT
ncbi:MAG: hypothetical protein NWQ14_04010 [Flavobacterium sp.]|jgi:hypothetical protein|nr:hypothetical protein [Flavobacterium sp.]